MFITVANIQAETAKEFGLPVEIMTAPNNRGEGHNGRNKRAYSHPRQVAMYLALELTYHKKSRIGQLFGGRDHSTVIHAVREVKRRLDTGELLRERVEKIREALTCTTVFHRSEACEPAPAKPIHCPMKQEKPKSDWRNREKEERRSLGRIHRAIMASIPHEPKVRDEDRVRRDPCIKCGIRGDIGCVHTRVAA